jgi:WD40 repeat protein
LIRIWSWHGKLLQTLEKQHEAVLALAYSADGEQIISGGMDDCLAIHSLPEGRVRTLATGHGAVNRVMFLEKLLISAGRDRALRLWEPGTGELVKTLDAHNDSVYTLAVSANGQLLASGGRDGTVRLWETSSWVRQGVLRGHKHSVLAVAVHPNGRTIASGSADGTIKFWDATSQELTASVESGHISVNFVVFPPGGEWLASGGTDQAVRFWGPESRPRRVGA